MAVREDFRQKLTKAFIESIEETDGLPWERGWKDVVTRPFNPSTGKKYRGGNIFSLMLKAIEQGSDDPRWMTLKQANDACLRIRKGAKAAYVEYWDWGPQKPKSEEDLNEKSEEEEEKNAQSKPRVFYAAVFNGCDIVGIPPIKNEITWKPNEIAEQLIAATKANIEHTALSRVNNRVLENKAYYLHSSDKIVIPPRGSFNSAGDYYATTLHEVGHWTGHFSRLARKSVDEKWLFGSPEYAQEELRAEIASMFLNSMVGIDGKIQNHAKYTRSWLEILKGDKHELFRATRDAESIVDYILEFAPELREAIDLQIANNILSKESQKPKPDSGISPDLPKFGPLKEEENERGDPRWQAFEKKVYSSAKELRIDDASVDKALKVIAPKFSSLIDAAGKNGYNADDINKMLSDRVIEEMRTAEKQCQQWEGFCAQVREVGAGLYPQSRIENALQELGGRYWQLISKSKEMGWGKENTADEIRKLIFGNEGRRPITEEYVRTMVDRAATTKVDKSVDDDIMLGTTQVPDEGLQDIEFV